MARQDAAQRAGGTDDPHALVRNGEAAHRQAQEGTRSAGRSPEHDRGLSADGQGTAHANPLDTFAAVDNQSQQNAAGIEQLYTLCAVSTGANTPQVIDAPQENVGVSEWRGALSVTLPRGTLKDIRFVVIKR